MTNLYFLTFRFLLISGFVSLVSILSSQEANTLDISSPARIAGSYRVSQPSDTIAVVVDNLSGMAQFVDACEPIGDDMDGIIVGIAESSECSLLEQVQNILDTDAIGILICHSKESQGIPPLTEEVIGMKGLNVPVFNMSYQECIEIKSEIGSDPFDVLISYSCDGIVVEDVIWGDQQGQGDFSNGLGEWTVVSDGDTSWYWTLDKVVPGRYTADSRVVEGTACNGYMIFPSDFYDNNGEYLIPGDPTDGPNTGAGPCPNQALQSDFCAGSLYSPVIDLSGDEPEGLFCRFYHDWGYYYAGSTSLIVSYDGGETWADTTHITLGERADTELNPEVNISGECPPVIATVNDRGEGFYSIPILSYNGQTSIQLQFRHLGGYYHTTIDDVALVAKKQIDIQPVHATAAKAPAAAIPLCQVSEIPLHIGVVNKGNILADNIIAKADVIGPSGNLEATVLNNNYSDKEPFCYEENHPSFSEGFTPTQLGEYHVSYKSVTEGDANQNNDLVSFSFETTERTWRSVDRSIKSSDGLYKHMFSGFNYSLDTKLCVFKSIFAYPFYLPQGEGQFLNSFTFGVNSLESNLGEVRAYILEWNPTAESLISDFGVGDFTMAHEDRILVGMMGENAYGQEMNGQPIRYDFGDQTKLTVKMASASYSIEEGEHYLLDAEGRQQPIPLKNDQRYALVLVLDSEIADAIELIAGDTGLNTNLNFDASNLAFEQLQIDHRYGVAWNCSDAEDGYEFEIDTIDFKRFFLENVPWLEMDISSNDRVECGLSNTNEIEPTHQSVLKVYPNPTKDLLHIAYTPSKLGDSVNFMLVDIGGRSFDLVSTEIGEGKYTTDVQHLPPGLYTLKVKTKAEAVYEKVLILR